MMLKKLKLPKILPAAYESYRGDGEWHKSRIFILCLLSAAISIYAGDLTGAALPAMALAISVLAGFTFTALFSSGSLTTNDLPKPRNESDRADIEKLNQILENFRARTRLFLTTSVICLALVLLVSIPLDWNIVDTHIAKIALGNRDSVFSLFRMIHYYVSNFLVFITFLVFGEMLHLFYRLSESIFSTLDIRRNYLRPR